MERRALGRTGLMVSALGFGSWPMGGDRYGAIEDAEAIRAIHRALDAGVNCVDTAPAYGSGHAEEVVGQALAGREPARGVAPAVPGSRRAANQALAACPGAR